MALFPQTLLAISATEFGWNSALDYDLFSGPLDDVSNYAGSLTSGSGESFSIVPAEGPSQYYLLRLAGEFCNDRGNWSSAGSGESPGRAAALP